MTDRANRIAAVATDLAPELSTSEQATVGRAAALAKFDLGSKMVVELTSLAGVMAREYALRAGETGSRGAGAVRHGAPAGCG